MYHNVFFLPFFLAPSHLQSALIRGKCNGQQPHYLPHHQMNLILILSLPVIHMQCFLSNRVYCSLLPISFYIRPGWPLLILLPTHRGRQRSSLLGSKPPPNGTRHSRQLTSPTPYDFPRPSPFVLRIEPKRL